MYSDDIDIFKRNIDKALIEMTDRCFGMYISDPSDVIKATPDFKIKVKNAWAEFTVNLRLALYKFVHKSSLRQSSMDALYTLINEIWIDVAIPETGEISKRYPMYLRRLTSLQSKIWVNEISMAIDRHRYM